jgi:hypothetical protein
METGIHTFFRLHRGWCRHPGTRVNTVAYRIQRIERLASLDLTNPDHRLSAHVATKIVESQMVGSLPI